MGDWCVMELEDMKRENVKREDVGHGALRRFASSRLHVFTFHVARLIDLRHEDVTRDGSHRSSSSRLHVFTFHVPRFIASLFVGGALVVAAHPARADDLTNLGDDKVMSSLSDMGLDTLLDRMFEQKHTPQSQRDGLKALRALHELSDPNVHLTNSQRQHHIKTAVDGLTVLLPTIDDPDRLVAYAASLLEAGVEPDVNTLEYWGDNPVTESRLKTVVQMVLALLDRASSVADAKANAMANNLQGANDPNAAVWEKLDNLSHNATYHRNMFAYYLMLATDRSTDDGRRERARIGDAALKILANFDNSDSGVMATVRLTMAKIDLAKGSYTDAKTKFDSLIDNSNNEVVPPPTPGERYEARYFHLVADLENRNLDAARAGLTKLITWQKATLPSDKATQDQLAAAAEMMRYRIFSAEASQTDDPAVRKTADDNAVAVLEKLKNDQPRFAPLIYEQLMNRIPADKPVATLDPLILQGLMNKGIAEINKPPTEQANVAVMDRAIEAAREIVTRQDRTGISPDLADDAQILVPTLLDREGRSLDAAAGYLTYAQQSWPSNLQQAKEALDRAGFLVFTAKKKDPGDAKLGALYDHFLEVAIQPPFNHTELTYLYAKHLRAIDKPAEAATYFRMVPPTEANYLNAQYFLLLSLKDTLDTKLTAAARARTVAEMQTVGDTVKRLGSASKEPLDRFKAAHATLIAAEVAVGEPESKDPKRALSLLDGFEQQVSGLPGEKELVSEALFVRVNAYMALGQLDQATGPLLGLLDKSPDSAPALVQQLLEQLDTQFARADLANDRATKKDIATNEAKLTGFLSTWAANNKDPKIRGMAYEYRVYDAKTKLTAGTLEDDPKTRQTNLEAAKAVYNDLLSDQNHALYVATLDPRKTDASSLDLPDPRVQVGLAFADYELKDYVDAQELLGDLIGNHRLGSPTVEVTENNETKLKDNDLYWEATAKLMECNIQLAKSDRPDAKQIMAGCQKGLKQYLIRGGIPERWQPQFEAMRNDILPDFVPPSSNTVAAATQPAAPVSNK